MAAVSPCAHFHAEIRSLERLERELVGCVVTHEQHSGRTDLGTHGRERLAFVGGDERQLADLLAVADREVTDVVRDLGEVAQDDVDLVGVSDRTVVNRDRRRLLLQRDLWVLLDELGESAEQDRSSFPHGRIEIEGEVDVELGAMGTNQMDLGLEAG